MARPVMRPRRPNHPARASHTSKRRPQRRVTYTELSSDDDYPEPESITPPSRRTRSSAPNTPTKSPNLSRKRKATAQAQTRHSAKKQRTSQTKKSRTKVRPFAHRKFKEDGSPALTKKSASNIQFTGKKMPWQSLPYHILEVIFHYASQPLMTENLESSPSVKWLLDTALLCRGFAEPALTALYYSPPLPSSLRLAGLVETLKAQSESHWIKYRAKIKYLEIEASGFFGQKGEGISIFRNILQLTPLLRGIDFRLATDGPRFQHGMGSTRRGYAACPFPDELARVMTDARIQLKDWTWNGLLSERTSPLQYEVAHRTEAFSTLQDLHILNLDQRLYSVLRDPPSSSNGDQWIETETTSTSISLILPRTLAALPQLQHLRFTRCDALEFTNLALLPPLTTLEINNCSLESPHLSAYLQASGTKLKTLILDHNQHLNLDFTAHLAASCPSLQTLSMDLIYYSPLLVTSITEPQYPTLLSDSVTPTWPPALTTLSLHHLRKWDTPTSARFFTSLTSAAKDLPNLRTIRIKASISESGWRARKEFKDYWVATLRDVFLRDTPDPNPAWTSLYAFAEWKRAQNPERVQSVQVPLRGKESHPVDVIVINEDTPGDAAPSSPPPPRRRSSRRQLPARPVPQPHSTAPSEDENEDDTETEDAPPLFRQGQCSIVDLRIDSQRPMEEQFGEDDFLDEEISGDEDWTGDVDDFVGGGGYAW